MIEKKTPRKKNETELIINIPLVESEKTASFSLTVRGNETKTCFHSVDDDDEPSKKSFKKMRKNVLLENP